MGTNVFDHQSVKNADLLVEIVESRIEVFEVRMQTFKISLTSSAIPLDRSTDPASCFRKDCNAFRNVELLQSGKRIGEDNPRRIVEELVVPAVVDLVQVPEEREHQALLTREWSQAPIVLRGVIIDVSGPPNRIEDFVNLMSCHEVGIDLKRDCLVVLADPTT